MAVCIAKKHIPIYMAYAVYIPRFCVDSTCIGLIHVVMGMVRHSVHMESLSDLE